MLKIIKPKNGLRLQRIETLHYIAGLRIGLEFMYNRLKEISSPQGQESLNNLYRSYIEIMGILSEADWPKGLAFANKLYTFSEGLNVMGEGGVLKPIMAFCISSESKESCAFSQLIFP